MPRVCDLDDDRIYHWHVGCDWNPVIEKTRILQASIVTVNVFLVQRPTDALSRAALVLAFDLKRVDRLARIRHHGIADNLGAAGLSVNLDVDNMDAEAGT